VTDPVRDQVKVSEKVLQSANEYIDEAGPFAETTVEYGIVISAWLDEHKGLPPCQYCGGHLDGQPHEYDFPWDVICYKCDKTTRVVERRVYLVSPQQEGGTP
jgi:hypothetical protein